MKKTIMTTIIAACFAFSANADDVLPAPVNMAGNVDLQRAAIEDLLPVEDSSGYVGTYYQHQGWVIHTYNYSLTPEEVCDRLSSVGVEMLMVRNVRVADGDVTRSPDVTCK